jgi:hypothetical protein
MPQMKDSMQFQTVQNEKGEVNAQLEGPKLAFRSLLDSGATFPTLHTEDFLRLSIYPTQYACQSVNAMKTAAGVVNARVYELFVCVLDNNGGHLVHLDDPVFPIGPTYLGSLCPVVESVVPLQMDENGIEKDCRLSGLLPFLAYYVSRIPTKNFLRFGEDRNDVLGHHRIPGQKKWDISFGHILSRNLLVPEDRFDNPRTTFWHR